MIHSSTFTDIQPFLEKLFVGGEWIAPLGQGRLPVIDPSTEELLGHCPIASAEDVNKAVKEAARAFETFSQTTREERLELLERFGDSFSRHSEAMAELLVYELGAPIDFARDGHCDVVYAHVADFTDALKEYQFDEIFDDIADLRHEPIGVCGLITPWNWPPNQIALKVLAALAAGCTMVLKPSEVTPMCAALFARVVDEAGIPPGVFNMVQGDGPTTGAALSRHPGVNHVSFTGSTRGGIAVAQAAAANVTPITTELGGKSPNIIFADADLEVAITRGVSSCFENTGQSCDAPTRMLVERDVYDRAVELAGSFAAAQAVGDPRQAGDHLGPLVNKTQFDHVRKMIKCGIDEGARLIAGGPERPAGHPKGYFVRPTVFADVHNDMDIAQIEIFGPVLVMIPFETEQEAVEIANASPYGLAAYIESGDEVRAQRVAAKLRAGIVRINGAPIPDGAPFGGYKASGIGREGGRHGIAEFQQIKIIAIAR